MANNNNNDDQIHSEHINDNANTSITVNPTGCLKRLKTIGSSFVDILLAEETTSAVERSDSSITPIGASALHDGSGSVHSSLELGNTQGERTRGSGYCGGSRTTYLDRGARMARDCVDHAYIHYIRPLAQNVTRRIQQWREDALRRRVENLV